MEAIGLVDGKVIKLNEKVIEIEDRGYQFGDGVYEVTRVYNRCPFALKLHIDRLYRSLREVGIPITYGGEELARLHDLLIEKSGIGEGYIYLQITRGVAPRGHAFPDHPVPRLMMIIQTVTADHVSRDRGATGIFVPDERWLRCDIKSINLLANVMAKQRSKEAGVFEAVLARRKDPHAAQASNVSLGDIVTEGAMSNFFVVKDGALWTHPANHLILKGISRTVILEQLAPKLGIPVVEKPYDVGFAKDADEAFVAVTVVEIMPLVVLDGAPVGNGKVGPVTRRLIEAFTVLVAKECGTRQAGGAA